MSRFREARDKGCEYLLTQVRKDGSFGSAERGVTEYYKVPCALQACGETNVANRLLDWVRRSGRMPDGDFGPRPEAAKNSEAYSYPNTWLVVGAQRLGQFDLAEQGMAFLMGFWNPGTGGFYSSYGERGPDAKEDAWLVTACGLAALYTGRVEIAEGVGRWLERLMQDQPNYPIQLYTVMTQATGLITSSDHVRYVVSQNVERDQYFFQPGYAAGFLARLFQSTGDEQWLDLAREYMRFVEGAGDYLFGLLRAGKVAWGASVMYTLTGDKRYKDIAIRIGENQIAMQSDDGRWVAAGKAAASNDTTAATVFWLDEIYQAVGDG